MSNCLFSVLNILLDLKNPLLTLHLKGDRFFFHLKHRLKGRERIRQISVFILSETHFFFFVYQPALESGLSA